MSKSLQNNLNSLLKDELLDLLDFFGLNLPDRTRKNELVRKFADYILEEPARWLTLMFERDLRLLKKLVDLGPGVPLTVQIPDYPTILEVAGVVEVKFLESGSKQVWITGEVHASVCGHVNAVLEEREELGVLEMERAALGYLNLYGLIPLESFYRKMDEFFAFARKMSKDDYLRFLLQGPVFRLSEIEIDDEAYLASPCLTDPVEVVLRQRDYENPDGLKAFSPAEAVAVGESSPFFVYGLDSNKGKAFVKVLEKLGYKGEELTAEAHRTWIRAQMLGEIENSDSVFAPVFENQEMLDDREYNHCLNAIADYANSLPKWVLKGNSSDEAGTMRIILKNEDEEAEEPGSDVPWKSLLDGNPLLNLIVPPAPGDSPCPCGSGLSYRLCHGKLKN